MCGLRDLFPSGGLIEFLALGVLIAPPVGLGFLRRFRFEVGNIEAIEAPQPDGYIFIDRAGMRLFFGDAEFREAVENLMSLNFQLPGQLVDPNLLHRKSNLY